MKHLLLLSCLILGACSICQWEYPLDGKAQQWCIMKEAAIDVCGEKNLLSYDYDDRGKIGVRIVCLNNREAIR